ncbi:dnaJ homolog subfamily B member 9-like [Athalia rosae]|uniref:dnaJ homolog subfamily B member 9-like n=1 Tax=Athalia rosae TaxID=37344 RepID=UPI0020347A39|nr:dnaJ homolog subfamily B member 9-like [Athalia rosae]
MNCQRLYSYLLIDGKLKFRTCLIRFKSHYDSLGLTPKATQNEIKTAYYELSKVYHPDKNDSESAKHKYQGITEAYEILGNYNSRKMYDRGMRPGTKHTSSQTTVKQKKDVQSRFYQSRLHRHKLVMEDGRTPIYDFDEWTKNHYSNLFRNTKEMKDCWQTVQDRTKSYHHKDSWSIFAILFTVTLTFSSLLLSEMQSSLDQNNLDLKKKTPEPT